MISTSLPLHLLHLSILLKTSPKGYRSSSVRLRYLLVTQKSGITRKQGGLNKNGEAGGARTHNILFHRYPPDVTRLSLIFEFFRFP